MEQTLLKIRDFAARAHGTQTRKYTPDPYIVHPVRVMELCRQYTNDNSILAAALLHDVLEDTEVNKQEMLQFLSGCMDPAQAKRTLQLVDDLTDVYVKSDYPQWNRRKRKAKELERLALVQPDSQTIKYADIIDNSREIVAHDPDFAGIFLHECRKLLEKMTRGNPTLYQKAIETVNNSLNQLKEA